MLFVFPIPVTVLLLFIFSALEGRGVIEGIRLSFKVFNPQPRFRSLNDSMDAVAGREGWFGLEGFIIPDRYMSFEPDVGGISLNLAFLVAEKDPALGPFKALRTQALELQKDMSDLEPGEVISRELLTRYMDLVRKFSDAVLNTRPPDRYVAVAWWTSENNLPTFIPPSPQGREEDNSDQIKSLGTREILIQSRRRIINALEYMISSSSPIRADGLLGGVPDHISRQLADKGIKPPAALLDTGFKPTFRFQALKYLAGLLVLEFLVLTARALKRPGRKMVWVPTDKLEQYLDDNDGN